MMKIVLILIVASIAGLSLTAPTIPVLNKTVNWTTFTVEDYGSLVREPDHYYLVQFIRGECSDLCLKDKNLIKNNQDEFLKLEPALEFKTVDLSEDVANTLGVNDSSSIYLFYKGQPIRADHYGLGRPPKWSVQESIVNILSNNPVELKTKEEYEAAFKSEYTFVFYGNQKSKYWNDIELTSKLVVPKIYFTSNKMIAKKYTLLKRNHFYAASQNRKRTFQMAGKPFHSYAVSFVHMVSLPYPMEFNIERYEEATFSQGIMLFYRLGQDDEKQIKKVFHRHDDLFRPNFYVFRLTDLTDKEQKAIIDKCSHPEKDLQHILCIVVGGIEKGVRYIYDETDFTSNGVVDFVSGYINDLIMPYLKTSKIDHKFSGKVRNLNAHDYIKFTSQNKKDHSHKVVMYYDSKTPADHHAILEDVAAKVDSGKVKIGKMDIDLNDMTAHSPAGLYFSSSWDAGTIFDYGGEWLADQIREWIEQIVKYQDEYFMDVRNYESTDL